MKTNNRMNDAERKAAWETVDTLEEAVEEALAHPEFAASSDPYYSDMTDAIWAMIARCHQRPALTDTTPIPDRVKLLPRAGQ